MSYNNYGGGNYQPRQYSNNNSGYQRRSYGNRSNGYQARSNQPAKKHSGCTMRINYTTKSGKLKAAIMYGWNYSRMRGGIVKFVAVPGKDTTVNNKSGKDLSKWVAKVQWADGRTETKTCFFNRGTNKLTIPDLSMVANPNAPNGGYFGRAFRK